MKIEKKKLQLMTWQHYAMDLTKNFEQTSFLKCRWQYTLWETKTPVFLMENFNLHPILTYFYLNFDKTQDSRKTSQKSQQMHQGWRFLLTTVTKKKGSESEKSRTSIVKANLFFINKLSDVH